MIHIVAILTTQPGQRAAVLEAFRANMPTVHAEAGCIEYQPVVDVPSLGSFQTNLGEDTFMVIEKWESAEALAAHGSAPHMVAYGRATKPMMAGRVIHVLAAA